MLSSISKVFQEVIPLNFFKSKLLHQSGFYLAGGFSKRPDWPTARLPRLCWKRNGSREKIQMENSCE
jgi:hypothetical protein